MDILYTTAQGIDGVVFAERVAAESVARIHAALNGSRTWGELRAALTPEEYGEILGNNELEADELSPDDGFDADRDVTGYADGYYPAFLQRNMLQWFPRDLAAKYGRVHATLHDGEVLVLPADQAQAIAAELIARGHAVERSELLFY